MKTYKTNGCLVSTYREVCRGLPVIDLLGEIVDSGARTKGALSKFVEFREADRLMEFEGSPCALVGRAEWDPLWDRLA